MGLPDYNHIYAQWGVVIEGEMELRLDGKRSNTSSAASKHTRSASAAKTGNP